MAARATKETPQGTGPHTSCELADIFRAHGPDYIRAHPLPATHRKVIRAITACRTAALGGHLQRCDSCGYERPAYNSCRNRHCPKCQSLAKAQWLEARRAELLPVGYFHLVFTLPHQLNPLALYNKKTVYNILFRCAARTIKAFGADPRHDLEGRMGFTAILHTWDQLLRYHVHLHCLVPGGALSPDGTEWRSAPQNFLFPVRALSRVFRGKCIQALQQSFTAGELTYPADSGGIIDRLMRSLRDNEWVVYCKKPFSDADSVLDYLGRYTHRVAISNDRILSLVEGKVRFTYRDRRRGNRFRCARVSAEELIRRFLLHVLPDSFMRIRHFGFLSNCSKARWLPVCRRLLGAPAQLPTPEELTTEELLFQLTGTDPRRCPYCENGIMQVVRRLEPIIELWHLACSGIPPPEKVAS